MIYLIRSLSESIDRYIKILHSHLERAHFTKMPMLHITVVAEDPNKTGRIEIRLDTMGVRFWDVREGNVVRREPYWLISGRNKARRYVGMIFSRPIRLKFAPEKGVSSELLSREWRGWLEIVDWPWFERPIEQVL